MLDRLTEASTSSLAIFCELFAHYHFPMSDTVGRTGTCTYMGMYIYIYIRFFHVYIFCLVASAILVSVGGLFRKRASASKFLHWARGGVPFYDILYRYIHQTYVASVLLGEGVLFYSPHFLGIATAQG